MNRLTLPALMLALTIVLAACAADGGDTTAAPEPTDAPMTESADDMAMDDMAQGDEGDDEEGDDHGEEFTWGSPADASEASRTIEIEADDDFTFDPAEVEVEVGETVTFSVTNVGQLPHDFTLGDAETQQAHEEEMAEMEGDMDRGATEPNAVTIPAGETVETTWTFTEPGEILIGCHVPGHYDAGMRGTITIADAS
ncbi:cupredoxin domain-containing protein [Euzebya pacifica]|uniref:cupredoxin domain-containing protein n=1 Tax=Euzebya pacifica TaxID=1608957 RepID=UPI0030F74D9D